jgi:hypothetical protein
MTPGIFMSTGYHYLNSMLLAFFAKLLGKPEEAQKHTDRAAFVKEKMLENGCRKTALFAPALRPVRHLR